MNLSICIIAVIGLLGMCTPKSMYVGDSNQVMEYQMEGNQYVVVVVMDGVSASEAKRMARQRAAEITAQMGNRYFTIDSEMETKVIKTDNANQPLYGNMYQELIIERDFGRDRSFQTAPITAQYPAIRLVFTSYKDRSSMRAIDACKLTNCGG